MSVTPPNDYVDEVWLQVIDLYIEDDRTQQPIRELLLMTKKLVADPSNAREILDQEYLARRNAADANRTG